MRSIGKWRQVFARFGPSCSFCGGRPKLDKGCPCKEVLKKTAREETVGISAPADLLQKNCAFLPSRSFKYRGFHDCHVPVQKITHWDPCRRPKRTLLAGSRPCLVQSYPAANQSRAPYTRPDSLSLQVNTDCPAIPESTWHIMKKRIQPCLEDPYKVNIPCNSLQRMYHAAHLAHGVVVVRFKILPGSGPARVRDAWQSCWYLRDIFK